MTCSASSANAVRPTASGTHRRQPDHMPARISADAGEHHPDRCQERADAEEREHDDHLRLVELRVPQRDRQSVRRGR